MKKSLSEITMKQFVSLMCGDHSVLLEKDEKADEESLDRRASELMFRYRMIVSPGQAKADLYDMEEKIKIHMRILLTNTLQVLHALGYTEDVVSMLQDVGRYTDAEHVPVVLRSMRAECDYLLKRRNDASAERRRKTPEEICDYFDSESATLMTFFKMQINLAEITAGAYANMLYQAEQQAKRMSRKA